MAKLPPEPPFADDPLSTGAMDEFTPDSSELTGTVLRGVGLAAIGFVAAQALTLAFYLALARIATPEDFGEFAAASIVVNAGLLFVESGMLAALIHRRDRVEEAANTAVLATAAAGLLFALLALALSPLVGLLFDSGKIGELSAAMSGLLFLRSLQIVPEALLQRRFSFLRRMVVEPLQVIAFGVAAVIATSNGLGAWGLVIGFYASAATDVLLSWPLARWRPRLRLASFAMWRELVGYGRHVVAANFVHRAGDQIPTILIGRYVSEAALGQYRYGIRMAQTPLSLVVQAASYVLFPAFARISHERDRFVPAFLRSLRWFANVALPLGMILVPLGVPLAVILFGEVWRDAGYAAMALAAWTIGASLVSIASEAFKAEGRPALIAHMHGIAAIAGGAAMLALLDFDLVGVVSGFAFGTLLGGIYGIVRLGGVVGVGLGEMWAQIWPALVAALVMAGSLLPLELLVIDADGHGTTVGLALIGAEALLAAVIYLGVLTLAAPDTPAELRRLSGRLRRRPA